MKDTNPAGTCLLCQDRYQHAEASKHLRGCKGLKPGKTPAFLLQAEGQGMPQYWLHFVASSGATLRELDHFLRRTWLECCGHGSEFDIQGKRYATVPMEAGDPDMGSRLEDVLRPRLAFHYSYDYGSTTELSLKVLAGVELQGAKPKVRLLGRNDSPEHACTGCGKPAGIICGECALQGAGTLCDVCGKGHGCGEEMLLPLVNSPRTGICGYTG